MKYPRALFLPPVHQLAAHWLPPPPKGVSPTEVLGPPALESPGMLIFPLFPNNFLPIPPLPHDGVKEKFLTCSQTFKDQLF